MKQIVRLATVILGLMLCSSLYAQSRVITGTVKDQDGKPLPFLAVVVKGTTIGTYTDTAGKFALTVDQTSKTLSLSYPGMKSQEVPITENMTITMTSDALGLDEVVIGAVGISQEKKALGYAEQTVNSDELNNSGTSNIMGELDGKVAGLQVINSTGDAGGGTYIDLRGPTSLTGNNQPLVVIDGIPVDNSINSFEPNDGVGFQASGAGGAAYGGAQATNRGIDINPSDIESVTVLKGPAATALYGIAAANGALIITTKKGHKNETGALGIEVNTSLTWSTVNQLPAMQNTYAAGAWNNPLDPTTATYQPSATAASNGILTSWGPTISSLNNGSTMEYTPTGTTQLITPGTAPSQAYNPYNFFQTGIASDNNISFSGGTDKSSFRISLGNLYQTGIIPLNTYTKTTINLNGRTSLGKKLEASAGVNYTNSVNDKVQQGSNQSGVMLSLLRTPPTFDNSNGFSNAASQPSSYILPDMTQRNAWGGPNAFDNPYWTVNENPFVSTLNRVYGYTQLLYHVNDWIDVKWNAGGDMYGQDDKNSFSPLSDAAYGSGGIYVADYFNTQINSDFTVNVNKKLSDKLKLNVVIGQNYFNQTSNTRFAQGTNLVLPYFLDMSNATSYLASESEVQIRRSAFYGQAVLGYADQLYLTISGRDETTSTLAPNNDNFFYPSVDLGWVFTEALHMSTNKILPFGKIRISYADVGQDAPAQALETYYHTGTILDGFTTGTSFPFNGQPGYQISNIVSVIGNPNLLPQSTTSFELGTDLGFFQNRISLSATYYSEKTTNEIFTVPISFASGYASTLLNAGVVTNKGEEITLNTIPIKTKSGVRWDLDFNWSHNVNEVVSLAPGVNSLYIGGFNQYDVPGQPANEIYGIDYIRTPGTTFNPATPLQNVVLDDNKADPGYGLPIVGTQNQALANTQPKWIGGIMTNVSYKGFSLGVHMSIREGGYMWDGTYGAMEDYGTAAVTDNRGQAFAVPSGAVWGHIDPTTGQLVHNTGSGTASGAGSSVTSDPAIYGPEYYQNVAGAFSGVTSPMIFSASYVRISQINISYDLPAKVVKKMHFQKFTITVFANNPFLWDSYPGVDPETNLGGPANAQGVDYFNNPNTKSYGVRLNLAL